MGGQVFSVEGMLWDTTVSLNQPSSYEQEILSRVSLQPVALLTQPMSTASPTPILFILIFHILGPALLGFDAEPDDVRASSVG